MLRLAILISLMALAQAQDRTAPDPVILARLQALLPSDWFVIQPAVTTDQDAWPLLLQADKILKRIRTADKELWDASLAATSSHHPITVDQATLLSAWLESQVEAIGIFHKIIERTGINRPDGVVGDKITSISRELARAIIISSRVHAVRHEISAAWQDAKDIFHFFRMLETCAKSQIDELVAMSIESMDDKLLAHLAIDVPDHALILDALHNISKDHPIDVIGVIRRLVAVPSDIRLLASSPESGPEWLVELRKMNSFSQAMDSMLGDNNLSSTDVDRNMIDISSIGNHARVFDRENTIYMRIEWGKMIIKSNPTTFPEAAIILDGEQARSFEKRAGLTILIFPGFPDPTLFLSPRSPDISPEDKKRKADHVTADLNRLLREEENPIGVILTAAMTMSAKSMISMAFNAEATRRLTRMALAAASKRIETGKSLTSIDDIPFPGTMDSVPHDPFDGKPLRFDPQRQIIWSVGSDMVDDGGISPKDLVMHLS